MPEETQNNNSAHNAHSKRYLALEWLLSDLSRVSSVGARFWEKVDIRDDESSCWNWTASLDTSGYGRFKVRSHQSVSAHRVAFVLANNEHPKKMLVLHSCDNPKCVNPSHLRLGTAKDNSDDMYRRGRNVIPDRSGANNGNSKLNEAQVKAIKGMIAEGVSNVKIAPQFGVTHQLISKIKRGHIWSEVEL